MRAAPAWRTVLLPSLTQDNHYLQHHKSGDMCFDSTAAGPRGWQPLVSIGCSSGVTQPQDPAKDFLDSTYFCNWHCHMVQDQACTPLTCTVRGSLEIQPQGNLPV